MSICKLCGNDRPLIKAHIIPESFWSLPPTGEEAAKIISSKKGSHPKRTLTGVYDTELLCERCDVSLGQLDQHAAECLLRSDNFEEAQTSERPFARIYRDADPLKVQRFILSVAWRASISNHSFFERVSLGPYEEAIKGFLLNKIEAETGIEVMLGEFDKADPATLNPHATRFDKIRFWLIYANRFILYVKTDKRVTPNSLNECIIRKGRPVVSIVRSFDQSKELPVLQNLVRANPHAFRRKQFGA